jgi:hypothetical protein
MIRVYFNLHKKLLSIQEKVNGRWLVIEHSESVYLKSAKFKVSEKGRQRVLKRKVKQVHAYVEGIRVEPFELEDSERVRYNPYNNETFVTYGGEPIFEADLCSMMVVEGYPFVFVPL